VARRELYHPAIYDTARPVESLWAATAGGAVQGCAPLDRDESCDIAVIGGGYSGLSAALHLARDHGVEVRVLEAGDPGWGASGRSGGFCCSGAAKLSSRAMIRRFGLAETRAWRAAQAEAVALVRDLAAAEEIDIEAAGEGEIQVAHKPSRLKALGAEQAFLAESFGERTELWSKDELAERGYRGPEAHGALRSPLGFGLHPLKYAQGLARAALSHGARVHGHSRVTGWSRDGREHLLDTPGGRLRARRVILATNGFTPEALNPAFRGALLPVLSNIVTTRPLTAAEIAAQGLATRTPIFDTRNLLYYFRLLPDGRFLLGSRGGLSADPAAAAPMRRWMEGRLKAMFPAWAGVEISHYWRGLACLSADLVPHVGRLADDPSVAYALAYHGSGVATATWSGRAVAALVADGAAAAELPAVVTQPLKRFPLPGLRPLYLRLAYLGYRFRDEVM
jgi:glycine/D-amino acid oxidase-like deaminating enzyme